MKVLKEIRPQKEFPATRRTKRLPNLDYEAVLGCLSERELTEELKYIEDMLEEDTLTTQRFSELTTQKEQVIKELYRRTQ